MSKPYIGTITASWDFSHHRDMGWTTGQIMDYNRKDQVTGRAKILDKVIGRVNNGKRTKVTNKKKKPAGLSVHVQDSKKPVRKNVKNRHRRARVSKSKTGTSGKHPRRPTKH